MDNGIGLPLRGHPKWQRAMLQSRMINSDHIVNVSLSTISSWKDGRGFPVGQNWLALRHALTERLPISLRASWLSILDQAWEHCRSLGEMERIDTYNRYIGSSKAFDPLADAFARASEDEAIWFENQATERLHNSAPFLLDASKAAAAARGEGEFERGIRMIADAMQEHSASLQLAKLHLEAEASLRLQRASLFVLAKRRQEACDDYLLASDLLLPLNTQDAENAHKLLWETVAQEMIALDDFDQSLSFFRKILLHKTAPVKAWSILLNMAPDYKQGRALVDEMVNIGIQPNHITWTIFLKLAPDYRTAREIIDEMIQAGETPNLYTWNTILNMTPNIRIGREISREMIKTGIQPDQITWNTLLNQAPDHPTGREIIDEMIKAGEKPDHYTRTALLRLAPDYPTGREIIDEVVQAGEKPDLYTWNTLLKLAPDYPTGREIIDEIIQAGETPNTFSAQVMCNTVNSEQSATEITVLFAAYGLIDTRYMNQILARLASMVQAEKLLEWVSATLACLDVYPPAAVFDHVLTVYRKANQTKDALRIALAFPHLPSAQVLFSKQSIQKTADTYFQLEFYLGEEPHNAANALAYLYKIIGPREQLEHWVEIALGFPNLHTSRLAGLNDLL